MHNLDLKDQEHVLGAALLSGNRWSGSSLTDYVPRSQLGDGVYTRTPTLFGSSASRLALTRAASCGDTGLWALGLELQDKGLHSIIN